VELRLLSLQFHVAKVVILIEGRFAAKDPAKSEPQFGALNSRGAMTKREPFVAMNLLNF
jgi:hypothetical protein